MVYLHLVYSTKDRKRWLDPELRPELYRYKAGILKNLECPAILIGGVEDHVHILFQFSREQSIKNVVGDVKSGTSKWLHETRDDFAPFAWQTGYAVFSVSRSKVDDTRRYIEQQESHHAKMSFKDELRQMLDRHGIEYDERYLWD